MAAGKRIGSAFVQVRPDTKLFVREAAGPTRKAGESTGRTFGAAFAKAFAVIGAAGIGAALLTGMRSALATSKVDAILRAQLGGGEGAREAGRAVGRLMARGVITEVEQANAAIRAAVQQGLVDPRNVAELDRVAGRVANLGVVMGEEADRVASAVTTLIRTGLAKNVEEAFDIIQRGTELGANKAQDLLDTFTEYSTIFRSLGLDGAQALGLINQSLAAGARHSDLVADALKEFQIRAIDGSKLTAQGFTMLGLSARQMASDIAGGGPRAAAALDLTLDRLRAIEDPVKRNAAAVALFGTKAEDLAGALFALDLDTATKSLGQFEGAAKRAGDTMEQSAGARVDGFVSKVKTGLVDFLGVRVIPILERLGDSFSKNVLPKLQAFGGWVKDSLMPRLREFGGWVADKINPTIQDLARRLREDGAPALDRVRQAIADYRPQLEQVFGFIKGIAEFIQTRIVPTVGPMLSSALLVTSTAVAFLIKGIGFAVDSFNRMRTVVLVVADLIRDKFNQAKAVVSGFVDFVKGLPGAVLAAVGNLSNLLRSAGEDVVRGLWNGIKSMGGWLREKVSGFVTDSIPGPIRAVLQLGSPSRLTREMGRDTVRGFGLGVEDESSRLARLMGRVFGPRAGSGAGSAGPGGGGMVVHIGEVKAYSDRFSLTQLREELAMHGAA